MDLSTYTAQLRENLTTAAALGGDDAKNTAQALAAATDQANRLVLFNALSDLAAEISGSLVNQDVNVSLINGEVSVDVRDITVAPPAGEHATFEDITGDISRVTLRLVDQIKEKAEEAASQNGVSLNSWVSQAVKSALRDNWNGYSGSAYKSWAGGEGSRGGQPSTASRPAADATAGDTTGTADNPLQKDSGTEQDRG